MDSNYHHHIFHHNNKKKKLQSCQQQLLLLSMLYILLQPPTPQWWPPPRRRWWPFLVVIILAQHMELYSNSVGVEPSISLFWITHHPTRQLIHYYGSQISLNLVIDEGEPQTRTCLNSEQHYYYVHIYYTLLPFEDIEWIAFLKDDVELLCPVLPSREI